MRKKGLPWIADKNSKKANVGLLDNSSAEGKAISKTEADKIYEIKETAGKKITFDSDETIEFQIVNRLINSKKRAQRKIDREYARAVTRANVARFSPKLDSGLTGEQVAQRIRQGFVNRTPKKYSKSYLKILFDNIVTYFNLLMLVIAALMFFKGDARLTDYFFVLIVFFNLLIGIIQEIRAKQVTDRLSLIVTPRCMVIRDGKHQEIEQSQLVLDDIMILKSGDQIGTDAVVKEGLLEANESFQTGESLPIRKEPNAKLLAGSFVVSGQAVCQVTSVGEDTFAGLIQKEAKNYHKTTSQLRRTLNAFITVISFLILPLGVLMGYVNFNANMKSASFASAQAAFADAIKRTAASLIGMIPIGLILLTSVALAVGVIKLAQQHTLVQDIYSIERLARVNCLCFDKTGTLTDGTLKLEETIPLSTEPFDYHKFMCRYLGAAGETNQTARALSAVFKPDPSASAGKSVPFSSARKFSAVQFADGGTYVLGAPEYLYDKGNISLVGLVREKERLGFRTVMLCSASDIKDGAVIGGLAPLALFVISDHIRPEAVKTVKWFTDNDVRIKVISGDAPLTVSVIAGKCQIPDAGNYISLEGLSPEETAQAADKYTVFGRVSPDQKAILMRELKSEGQTVAMTGDGVNDILAMKQADCAIAMAQGTDATKGVAHVVLLNSDFSAMPRIVREGRRVVNNIQLSASLFIMKTVFTIMLTVMVLIMNLTKLKAAYPFSPHHLMLMEIIPIGTSAFFLALQPNDKLIKGSFFKYVLRNSLPGAFSMFIAVSAWMYIRQILAPAYVSSAYNLSFTSVEVLSLDMAAFVVLLLLCLPLNLYRSMVFFIAFGLMTLFVLLMPESISGVVLSSIDSIQWLLLLIIFLGIIAINLLTRFLTNKIIARRNSLKS